MMSNTTISGEREQFLKTLRTVTGPSHKKLEEVPLSAIIVSENVTLKHYARYLEKMRSYISEFESKIFPVLAGKIPDIEQRRKTQLLDRDLDYLKSKGISQAGAPPVNLSSNVSLLYALGCMYVIEGSTLGGKIIYKNISARLGVDAFNGAGYFAGYGPETGSKWTNFLEILCHYGTIEENEQEILRGAKDTFNTMLWLLND